MVGLGGGDSLLVVGELLLLLLLDADEDDGGADNEEKNQTTNDRTNYSAEGYFGLLLAATAPAAGEGGRFLEYVASLGGAEEIGISISRRSSICGRFLEGDCVSTNCGKSHGGGETCVVSIGSPLEHGLDEVR